MRDIKSLLKEAREAIKNKDYESTLKLSKSILKEDRKNYMGMVFLGLALQEIGPVEQASKAFQKAIDNSPENPLAWNGLINFYEKIDTPEAKTKLVELYMTTLNLETNTKKIIEYSEKLSKIHEIGDLVKITQSVYNCATKMEKDSIKIFETLAILYQGLKDTPKELLPIFDECFSKLLNLREYKRSEYYCSYLNLLYQQNRYEEVFTIAENMHNSFESDTVSLIWICKIYNQLFVENSELSVKFSEKIETYFCKLLKIEEKNAMGLFTKAIQNFLAENVVESKDILKEVCILRPGLVHAWVFLTKIYLKLNLTNDALDGFLSATKLLNSSKYSNVNLKHVLDNIQLEILSKSSNKEDWNKALEIFKNSDEKFQLNNLDHIILVNIYLENISEAKIMLTKLKAVDNVKARFFEAKILHKDMKYNEALNILENDKPDLLEWWIEIGTIYWSLRDYKGCLIPFLKAAKIDPNNYLCFMYLGNVYQKLLDVDKARRCYEKAFNLNKHSQETAIQLSKIYCKLKNWESAQNLLKSITEGPINEKTSWAWLQLGLSYLEQEDYSKAIEKLQFVVRIDKENTYCWQCLADAYFARGSYTSALKCYDKSLEYTQNTLYPMLQIASIKKILGLFEEAESEFSNIILNNEQYLPALKGLAETYMCLARSCYRDQRLGKARSHAQNAMKYLTIAVEERNNFSCLWKLIADTCLFVTNLPKKYCYLMVTQELVEGKTKIEIEDLFNLATSCYCKAISLLEDSILIWHDLSSCYLKHALFTESQDKRDMLLSYASAAAKHCAVSNPKNWQHWNLLGNIAMEKKPPERALAQHYFIKAVTIENNNPISWANLGILYSILGDIKLANKAFAQGQRSDPNYVNNWIGQALLAESMGVEEAMDLFRHSVQLDHHQQGAIGYGHWVCRTLLEAPQKTYSVDMHAVPVACDAITWYTEKNDNDGCAWNMLGILKERLKLHTGSLEAFKRAYDLSPDEGDLTKVNYGRLLLKQKKNCESHQRFSRSSGSYI